MWVQNGPYKWVTRRHKLRLKHLGRKKEEEEASLLVLAFSHAFPRLMTTGELWFSSDIAYLLKIKNLLLILYIYNIFFSNNLGSIIMDAFFSSEKITALPFFFLHFLKSLIIQKREDSFLRGMWSFKMRVG